MRVARFAGVLCLLAAFPARAEEPAKPLDNWQDLRAAFVRCWTVPKGTEGSVIAFRFLFAPNGGLRGAPRVQARILKGDAAAKKRFEAAAYATLDRCLPVSITPGFRAVMGESLLLLSLVNTPRRPRTESRAEHDDFRGGGEGRRGVASRPARCRTIKLSRNRHMA